MLFFLVNLFLFITKWLPRKKKYKRLLLLLVSIIKFQISVIVVGEKYKDVYQNDKSNYV